MMQFYVEFASQRHTGLYSIHRHSMAVLLCGIITIVAALLSASVDGCSTWTSVIPTDYNRTYMTPGNSAANATRPLGYRAGVVYYDKNLPRPCFIVEGTAGNGRHIELKLDIPQGTICINGNDQCVTATSKMCAAVTGDSIKYTFDCASCEGGQVNFWYRVVLESSETGAYDENWCSGRASDDYPSSLKQTSPQVIPTPPDTSPTDSAWSSVRLTYTKIACVLLWSTFILMRIQSSFLPHSY